jgi:N-acyl-D-amino-acid deacylase
MHDLLIKDAHLVDGLGGTPYGTDLAVAGGRIAAIGADLGAGSSKLRRVTARLAKM